ncbi:hypothetical protein, partial [Falsiroseomonas sp.]|uniref:hypothetical protein n=1 Tax=Falsiroseomonas sp. TaxID=2870721 RepID=UPI0035689023
PETYRLPDVAYGSEAWALVRLQLDEGALAGVEPGGLLQLLEIEVELVDTVSRERRFLPGALRLPVLRGEVLNALPHDELVASRARELESAELHMRIRAAVRAGDWRKAERLLAWAEQEAANHPWLREMVRTVRDLIARRDAEALEKETAYSSSRMRRRLAEKSQADLLNYDPAAEREKRSFLRRKSQQGRRQFGEGDEAGRNR